MYVRTYKFSRLCSFGKIEDLIFASSSILRFYIFCSCNVSHDCTWPRDYVQHLIKNPELDMSKLPSHMHITFTYHPEQIEKRGEANEMAAISVSKLIICHHHSQMSIVAILTCQITKPTLLVKCQIRNLSNISLLVNTACQITKPTLLVKCQITKLVKCILICHVTCQITKPTCQSKNIPQKF